LNETLVGVTVNLILPFATTDIVSLIDVCEGVVALYALFGLMTGVVLPFQIC
jgi:hypothetical protein